MTLILLAAAALLILLNGFFVAAEFALVRANRSRLETLAEEGARGAKLALKHVDEMDQALAACQVGITLASIAIGFLGEPALGSVLEPLLGGTLGHSAATIGSFALAYLIMTVLHITIGEQVPKIYAITKAERISRWCALPLQVFRLSFKPLILSLNAASNAMLRLLGINAGANLGEHGPSSPEELKILIAQGRVGGAIDSGEEAMLSGVFHLHEQQARQVMTPIPAVVTVDITDTAEVAVRRCVESNHSRLLVTEERSTDRVRGTVHLGALTKRMLAEGAQSSIEPCVNEALIIPETKPLDDLLADLQRQRVYLAVVVDEYGRVAGIVSVEDILEEIVGEIEDESDAASLDARQISNGDWILRGHVPLGDLDNYGIHLPIDSNAYNSLGGYVFAELGRLPKRGDSLRVNGHLLRVESVRDNRIQTLRLSKVISEEAQSQTADSEPVAPAPAASEPDPPPPGAGAGADADADADVGVDADLADPGKLSPPPNG